MNRKRQDGDPATWLHDQLTLQADEGRERIDWEAISTGTDRSPRQLSRLFHARYATTPARFLADLRAERARRLLSEGHDVLNAALRAGYSGPGRLHEAIVVRLGLTPGQVRAHGAGATISFGVFRLSIGIALLAATTRGICAIRLCTERGPRDHLADLQREFPRADFIEAPEQLQAIADQLADYLDRRAPAFEPDLDLNGTAFQREVWEHLRRIPPGHTTTYANIAREIGRPTAARAVARAVATNPVAIAIPCHRVVRTDGGIGGYRWGLAIKRQLLDLEEPSGSSVQREPGIVTETDY